MARKKPVSLSLKRVSDAITSLEADVRATRSLRPLERKRTLALLAALDQFAKLSAQSMEFIYKVLGIHKEPLVTLDKIDIMCRDRAFDLRKAKEDLRFVPKVGYEEGIERTVVWMKGAKLF